MPIVTIGSNTTDTFSGVEDTFLDAASPTSNFSGNGDVSVGKYDIGQHANGVFRFPGLSNITGPVTVTTARIHASIEFMNTAGGYTIEAFRLLRNTNLSQATWNVYSTGNNWGTAGGLSNGVDRIATASGSIVLAGSETGYIQITGAGLAQDVQDIINGVNPNYGWLLERTDAQDDNEFFAFRSTEEGTDGTLPYLYVDYTAGGGGSTPRSLLLMGVG